MRFRMSCRIVASPANFPNCEGGMNDWSHEETNEPLIADARNYYKVEKWTMDGSRIERLLYAGSNLDRAREIFVTTIKQRLRIRLTIRQRSGCCRSGRRNKKTPAQRGRG